MNNTKQVWEIWNDRISTLTAKVSDWMGDANYYSVQISTAKSEIKRLRRLLKSHYAVSH